MRKVEIEVITAFLNGESRRVGNTETDGRVLRLHGNVIAKQDGREVWITMAGWPTVTTRSRVNAVCQLAGSKSRVFQHKHEQYVSMPAGEMPMDTTAWYRVA